MTSPKAKPNKQKRMPKSSSVWPSMPRNLTCERSGSFKLASPPASSARAEAAARSATVTAAPNLVNLKHWDQAFVSQVRMQNPPLIAKFAERFDLCERFSKPGSFQHTSSAKRCPARAANRFFLIRPATGRRAPVRVTPRYRRRGARGTGRLGKHKSQIYNILGEMGQTTRRAAVGTFSAKSKWRQYLLHSICFPKLEHPPNVLRLAPSNSCPISKIICSAGRPKGASYPLWQERNPGPFLPQVHPYCRTRGRLEVFFQRL